MKKIITIALTTSLLLPIFAHAEVTPQRLAQDYRVKTVMYDANNIVVLKSRYGYQTQIVFAEDESVQSVSMGDSLAWQAVPVGNHLFIKPMTASSTNMTVITSGNSYNFHLESTDNSQTPTYKLQFVYPQMPTAFKTSIPKLTAQNYHYSYTGDKLLAPQQVFDDGKFTYFKFNQDGYHHIPAIFSVDKNRNETLINYHFQDNYVVVNQLAYQFTLRHGAYVTSVYNDFAIGHGKHAH